MPKAGGNHCSEVDYYFREPEVLLDCVTKRKSCEEMLRIGRRRINQSGQNSSTETCFTIDSLFMITLYVETIWIRLNILFPPLVTYVFYSLNDQCLYYFIF